MYKYDLKDARDSTRLAPGKRPFHNFAPLKEYPFCLLLVFFEWQLQNLHQFFVGLFKIAENFELEVV